MFGYSPSLGRRAAAALTVAGLLWGLFLLAAAFTFPAYEREVGVSEGGGVTTVGRSTVTLVEENGGWVVAVMAIPAVVAAVVGIALGRFAGGSRGAVHWAWSAIAVLVMVSTVAAASVGLLFLPTALALVAAALVAPPPGPR